MSKAIYHLLIEEGVSLWVLMSMTAEEIKEESEFRNKRKVK